MKIIFCDGLMEPHNPDGYGCAAWVAFEGDVDGSRTLAELPPPIASQRGCIARPGDRSTNNVAEYRSVRGALKWAVANAEDEEIEIRADSQLVVRQVSGDWACKADHLRPFRDDCRALLKLLPHARLVWVSRKQNIPADELTRLAYKEEIG